MGEIKTPEKLKPEAAEAAPPSLYADRQRVYPKAVFGKVRSVKWAVLILCLALYYLVPWLRWDRGQGMPDQAVLVEGGRLEDPAAFVRRLNTFLTEVVV